MKAEKKKKPLKKWIWNGSIVAALVASLIVFSVMLQVEKRMLTQYERGIIYVAAKEIPEGQLITHENYLEYFEKCLLDRSVIPATAVCEEAQVANLVAAVRIEEGVLLTEGMFEKLDEITAELKTPVLAGLKADDLYQMVGGILRAGDRINIYSVNQENQAELVWSDVYVQQVFDNAGKSIPNADTGTAVQRINVYLNGADVEELYSKLAAGSLRVVKVCR